MVEGNSSQLDRVFQALADGTRRALLARLCEGEATVGELAAPFDMTLAAVSKHIKVLERAALVEQHKQGRTRVCRMRPEALRSAAEQIAHYEKFWNQRLDALEAHLQRARDSTSKDADESGDA